MLQWRQSYSNTNNEDLNATNNSDELRFGTEMNQNIAARLLTNIEMMPKPRQLRLLKKKLNYILLRYKVLQNLMFTLNRSLMADKNDKNQYLKE